MQSNIVNNSTGQNNSGVSLAEAGRYWFSQGLNSIALAGDDLTAWEPAGNASSILATLKPYK